MGFTVQLLNLFKSPGSSTLNEPATWSHRISKRVRTVEFDLSSWLNLPTSQLAFVPTRSGFAHGLCLSVAIQWNADASEEFQSCAEASFFNEPMRLIKDEPVYITREFVGGNIFFEPALETCELTSAAGGGPAAGGVQWFQR